MRTVTLAADVATGRLYDSTAKELRDYVPALRRGDTMSIQLSLYDDDTGYTLPTTGGSYFIGVKPMREPMADTFLAETETVTAANGKLTFTLALTSATLASALSGAKEKCEAVLEVGYTDDDGRTTLASFRVDILNDYVKGTEGSPADDTPAYYTATQVLALLNARVVVPSGLRIVADELGNIVVETIE